MCEYLLDELGLDSLRLLDGLDQTHLLLLIASEWSQEALVHALAKLVAWKLKKLNHIAHEDLGLFKRQLSVDCGDEENDPDNERAEVEQVTLDFI